jgi:hypothetical protein
MREENPTTDYTTVPKTAKDKLEDINNRLTLAEQNFSGSVSDFCVYPELTPTGALAIFQPRPELTTHCRFLELGNLDVSHAALGATHLVAKARRLDWQNGHTPSP